MSFIIVILLIVYRNRLFNFSYNFGYNIFCLILTDCFFFLVVAGVTLAASEGMDDTRMDLSTLEEGTGRSVPSTPSHVSPQG